MIGKPKGWKINREDEKEPVNEKMNHDVYESKPLKAKLVDYADHFSIDEIDMIINKVKRNAHKSKVPESPEKTVMVI